MPNNRKTDEMRNRNSYKWGVSERMRVCENRKKPLCAHCPNPLLLRVELGERVAKREVFAHRFQVENGVVGWK